MMALRGDVSNPNYLKSNNAFTIIMPVKWNMQMLENTCILFLGKVDLEGEFGWDPGSLIGQLGNGDDQWVGRQLLSVSWPGDGISCRGSQTQSSPSRAVGMKGRGCVSLSSGWHITTAHESGISSDGHCVWALGPSVDPLKVQILSHFQECRLGAVTHMQVHTHACTHAYTHQPNQESTKFTCLGPHSREPKKLFFKCKVYLLLEPHMDTQRLPYLVQTQAFVPPLRTRGLASPCLLRRGWEQTERGSDATYGHC